MDHDDFEGRSASELINQILQQQEQIQSLQARIVELEARLNILQLSNGQQVPDLDDAPDATAGSIPRGVRVLALAFGMLACAIIAIIISFNPPALVSVGRAQDFQADSVTPLNLPAPNRNDTTIPIYLVNDARAGFLALDRRAPASGCLIQWIEADKQFEESCLDSTYTQTGEYLTGPTARGLDRFSITITESGEVLVNVNESQPGPPRP